MCISVLYFVCVAYGFDSQFPLGKIKILLLFRSLIRTFVAHLIYNVRVREKNHYGREGISGQI